jgi:hypothetical protein
MRQRTQTGDPSAPTCSLSTIMRPVGAEHEHAPRALHPDLLAEHEHAPTGPMRLGDCYLLFRSCVGREGSYVVEPAIVAALDLWC